ncbi:MAG: hypothetical protein AAF203_03900 [Pseudomonadota bacterium]
MTNLKRAAVALLSAMALLPLKAFATFAIGAPLLPIFFIFGLSMQDAMENGPAYKNNHISSVSVKNLKKLAQWSENYTDNCGDGIYTRTCWVALQFFVQTAVGYNTLVADNKEAEAQEIAEVITAISQFGHDRYQFPIQDEEDLMPVGMEVLFHVKGDKQTIRVAAQWASAVKEYCAIKGCTQPLRNFFGLDDYAGAPKYVFEAGSQETPDWVQTADKVNR